MADPRMSQLLPTIRCGTCTRDVPYRDLGTHICQEAPPMPEFPFQLSNKLKENVTKKYQSPASPNDDIHSPVSFCSEGYDSGYNSRVPSSGGFADNSNNEFDRWRTSASALRISTANVSSSFLEKYGQLGDQITDEDDFSDYEADEYVPIVPSRKDVNARQDRVLREITAVDQFARRGSSRSQEEGSPYIHTSPGATELSPEPHSDEDTLSVSHSIRSGGQPSARSNDEVGEHLCSPERRRSMRSSNASSSAQDYIARKYGISPPTGKEGEPLPPPKLDTTVAKSGPAPLKSLQDLFSLPLPSPKGQDLKKSPNDDAEAKAGDLSNEMKSLGKAFQRAVLIKPRDDDRTIKKISKCGSCKRNIFATEKSLEAIGSAFHVSCFRCDQCDIPIDYKTNFQHINGKVLCEQSCGPAALKSAAAERNRLPTKVNAKSVPAPTELKKDRLDCHDCHKPITGRPVYAMRKAYHEGHLRCQHCRSPIQPSVGHVEHAGNVYCPADFAQLFLPKCHTCTDPIESEAVCALDKNWHPECFGCQVCHDPFPDKSFYVFDNNPLCRRHYHEQNNSLCHGCDEPIEGPCAQIQPDNQSGNQLDRYHPPCFSCTECRRPLNDIYYNFGGQPYCERHIMEIQRRKNIRVERRRTVFSVLPPRR